MREAISFRLLISKIRAMLLPILLAKYIKRYYMNYIIIMVDICSVEPIKYLDRIVQS